MKKKLKEILLTMASFGILIYLGHHTYLLEWLAERWFCFIWAPIQLLWLFRQDILARWLTFGAFGGMFLGQIAEDIKWEVLGIESQIVHSSYWGVGIWFTVVLLSLMLGIFHTWLKNKKKKEAKLMEEARKQVENNKKTAE
ncbi:MAG: hypothetical protein IJO21_02400 [Oscillospiraceae bacterium]|nr:hypothetical protein [Oscillospiraceae bacterium]